MKGKNLRFIIKLIQNRLNFMSSSLRVKFYNTQIKFPRFSKQMNLCTVLVAFVGDFIIRRLGNYYSTVNFCDIQPNLPYRAKSSFTFKKKAQK